MHNVIDMVTEGVERATDPRFGRDGLNIVLATNRESSDRMRGEGRTCVWPR